MHKHGNEYRAKIVAGNGKIEYSEWFNSVDALRKAMAMTSRDGNTQYHCESRPVRCAETACDVDQTPKIISRL
jgi:hypothetical protein